MTRFNKYVTRGDEVYVKSGILNSCLSGYDIIWLLFWLSHKNKQVSGSHNNYYCCHLCHNIKRRWDNKYIYVKCVITKCVKETICLLPYVLILV